MKSPSSTAVYFTSRPSNRSLVLRQNGQVVFEKTTTCEGRDVEAGVTE